jgi:hypothetical protein
MSYESTRGKVVMFGGANDLKLINETWEWNGLDWTQLRPTVKPSARQEHAMAFDSARGKVVMFGGSSGGNETWEWDGAANERAGQNVEIAALATDVIGESATAQLTQLTAKFFSGGIGYPQGVVTNGVNLMAWYDNEWHTVASNGDGPKAPGLVEWDTSDEKMIWKMLYSGGMNFNFAVVPQAPNGFGHLNCPSDWTAEECDMGMVSTEYVEVTLKYTLP